MSQPEQPLGALYVDIIAPAGTESTFQCLAELADRAFTLADEQAGLDPSNIPLGLKGRYANIFYPIGNIDVEPFPVKAILHQNSPPMQTQQVVIDFESRTAECEGHPNLPIEPEQIEHAREEIKLYLQEIWEEKRAREKARQLQNNLAWGDFLERLESSGIFCVESPSDSGSPHTFGRCPICGAQTAACTSCRAIMCLNRDCAASQLIPFQSCSYHVSTSTCLPCLESANAIPPLGQCPGCNLWFCHFELTWCLGRPKNGLNLSRYPHRMPDSAREHPTRPIGCSSCTGGQDCPHCSNGKCWSRVAEYGTVCETCSPGGGLWCTCGRYWICDDCKAPPMESPFKECPRCKRVYCIYDCEYIQFCAECGRATLCDDCIEEEWDPLLEPNAAEGITLVGECHVSQCIGKICGPCLEDTRCVGCSETFCSPCVQLRGCNSPCDGRFCPPCLRAHKRRRGGGDAGKEFC